MRSFLTTLTAPFTRYAQRRALRRIQRQWAEHTPQQQLLVFIRLMQANPALANEFRRALRMQDAPKPKDEPRVVLAGEFQSRPKGRVN